ncbi:TMAO reductase system sensor histidine kinase/response regulator TorS [Shewanella sp. UCD-KL12]|uniref:TMAO reductase system sensor histidine kinase/response regulator TorS n=1 Tax=Shewanella sp. UCD-KL12 TaxID=1917163 RepID=UPI0009705B4A|nr:TMAO reductase system sensor histidine kinase/response regulator TorS [Shewanella sp. UCD-KL12]
MPFTLSGKSLVGRLMLSFCLLGFLLLLLVSLGSLSLYWVKQADQFLYNKALPASQAARELVQSSNALAESAKALGNVEEEAQRQFIGRTLSINSTNLLSAIGLLKRLEVRSDHQLELSAGEIIHELSSLGVQVGKRLEVASELTQLGKDLVESASYSTELLEAELAVVDSAILSKLSLAYPEVAGELESAHLLDTVIEQDLDIQERLNRALTLIHNIALIGQLLQSPEQEGALLTLLSAMSQLPTISLPATYQLPSTPNAPSFNNARPQIDLMALELLKGLIRDPARSEEVSKEFSVLRKVSHGLALQQGYIHLLNKQERQLNTLSNKLAGLNQTLDSAMATQQQQVELARGDYLQQLFWAKTGLWSTGVLMFLVIISVMYLVIYKGIALRLNEASEALSRLSLGDTNVTINSHGDDELTAMANAIKAFKQKTAHNQKLQAELRSSASELTEHKAALEITVEARTQELAVANKRLDAEAKGHAQARTMAEEASQAKSLFLATMSHEIRTPLNGLLGTLTLLGHSDLPVAQKQMLALSQYSGTLLQTVLNDILDFSRLEQGKLTNEARPVAINDLLDEVVAIMLAGAGLAGLRLVLDSPKLPDWVSLDGPKLRQVLFNLIGNAIKFTPQGQVKLKVSFDQYKLYFEVSDTGVGISNDAKQQLFKAYSAQPNQGRSRGTGLGLAISKELVELMNLSGNPYDDTLDMSDKTAALWVNSEVDKGSCFGFSVPLIECQQALDEQAQQLQQVVKKRVLVIEDNKVNAMVAQGFLAHLGHDSELAGSCEEARVLYNSESAEQFDAIMLDIQLGDGSGFELLNELRAVNQRASHQLPIAAFTAQIQSDDLYHYQQVGFDIVLGKPLNMQSLAAWVGVACKPNTDSSVSIEAKAARGKEPARIKEAVIEDTPSLLELTQIRQDLEYLGKEAVLDMLDLFKQTSQVQLEKLGLFGSDTDKLLHALKGSSASMGLTALSALCKGLEKSDYQDSQHLQLVELLADSVAALQDFLARVEDE